MIDRPSRRSVDPAILALVGALLALSGCFVDRSGTLAGDGGGRDSGPDARMGCVPGLVDLDGDPANGCECVIGIETCDGTDEDCDRSIDEDVSRTCGPAGACAGIQTCISGSFGDCVPIATPPEEVCDGSIDEDCDGVVDEGCACSPPMSIDECGISDVGACAFGSRTCGVDGTWGDCSGQIGPVAEECDGALDEDCDGVVDEGCDCTTADTQPCPSGSDIGACVRGTETCDAAGMWGVCIGATGPVAERCDGTIDEDCDGDVDEGCVCTMGAIRMCGSRVGECEPGTETCDSTGSSWETCSGAGPVPETCDGRDDNCDGVIDNDSDADCAMATGCNVERLAGGTYLFCHMTRRSWVEARNWCDMFGYHLVTIDGSPEDAALISRAEMVSSGDWWIGDNDLDGDGMFDWVYMSSSYDNYRSGEPDSGECGVIRSRPDRRDWDGKDCGGDKRFICEAPPSGPVVIVP